MDKVQKSWGFEHWFVNNKQYCGKLLFVNSGLWSSNGAFHYHKIKHETFFVIDGILHLDYVTKAGKFKTIILEKWQSFTVEPGIKHRFTALNPEGCTFIEASTTHRDSDSYRVRWDKDNKQWINV